MANRKERRAAARNKENEASDAIAPDEVLGGGDDALPPGEAVPFPDHEEDVLFKAQMQVLNVLLGHWKTGLAVVGAVLFGVLVVGEYGAHQVDEQRGFQDKIADIDRRMPDQSPAEILDPTGSGLDPNLKANIEEGARRYEAVAGGSKGAAAVMAWLKAGSAWERAGDDEKAMTAYGAAHGVGASDVIGWSAASQLPTLRQPRVIRMRPSRHSSRFSLACLGSRLSKLRSALRPSLRTPVARKKASRRTTHSLQPIRVRRLSSRPTMAFAGSERLDEHRGGLRCGPGPERSARARCVIV